MSQLPRMVTKYLNGEQKYKIKAGPALVDQKIISPGKPVTLYLKLLVLFR